MLNVELYYKGGGGTTSTEFNDVEELRFHPNGMMLLVFPNDTKALVRPTFDYFVIEGKTDAFNDLDELEDLEAAEDVDEVEITLDDEGELCDCE